MPLQKGNETDEESIEETTPSIKIQNKNKPKKQLTEKQKEALARGRITAMENRKKKAEAKKLEKEVNKKELENKITTLKKKLKPEPEEPEEPDEEVIIKKPKTKRQPRRKIIYESESSETESDSDTPPPPPPRSRRVKKDKPVIKPENKPVSNVVFL